MAKIKVNELSKTLGVKSSDLVELLKSAGSAVKGYSSLMSDMDMNIVLEHYTKLYDDGTDIYEFMKSLCPAVPEVKEEPKKEEKKAEVEEEKDPKKQPNHSNEKRYVDTRANVVDLDKYKDSEKIEELAPELKDTVTNKQKIKKARRISRRRRKRLSFPSTQSPRKRKSWRSRFPMRSLCPSLPKSLKLRRTTLLSALC